MNDKEQDYTVRGEVIKMIHGELPAVRWACGKCGEDACVIFYDPGAEERLVECESCNAQNLVRRG
jgi:predicted nucleic acid-binding Zn ribbon protein